MQAVEIAAQIDDAGFLHLQKPLRLRNQKVRVIILLPESEELDDELWLQATGSPAFDFLHDPEEDVYTSEDGQPFASRP